MNNYYEKYLKYKSKYLKLKQLENAINGGMGIAYRNMRRIMNNAGRKITNVKKDSISSTMSNLLIAPKKIIWDTLVVPIARSINCENNKTVLSGNIIHLQSTILGIICVSTNPSNTTQINQTITPQQYYNFLENNTYILHPYFRYKIMSAYLEKKKTIIFSVYNEIDKYLKEFEKYKTQNANQNGNNDNNKNEEPYIDRYANEEANEYFKNILNTIYIKNGDDINTYLDKFYLWIQSKYINNNSIPNLLNNKTSYYFIYSTHNLNINIHDLEGINIDDIHIYNLESHIQSIPSAITINELHNVFTTIINETKNIDLQKAKFDNYTKKIIPKLDCLFTYSPSLHINTNQHFGKTSWSIYTRNTISPVFNLINQTLYTSKILHKTSQLQLFYYLIEFLNTINQCIPIESQYNSILLIESGITNGKIHALVNNTNPSITMRNIPIQTRNTQSINNDPNKNINIIKYNNTPYNFTNNNTSGYYIYLYDSTTLDNHETFEQILKKNIKNEPNNSEDNNEPNNNNNTNTNKKTLIQIDYKLKEFELKDQLSDTLFEINEDTPVTHVKINKDINILLGYLDTIINIMTCSISDIKTTNVKLTTINEEYEQFTQKSTQTANPIIDKFTPIYTKITEANMNILSLRELITNYENGYNQVVRICNLIQDIIDNNTTELDQLKKKKKNIEDNSESNKAEPEDTGNEQNTKDTSKSDEDETDTLINKKYKIKQKKITKINIDYRNIINDVNTNINTIENKLQTLTTSIGYIKGTLSQSITINDLSYRCYSNLETSGGSIHRILVPHCIYCKINSNFISFNNNKFLLHLKTNRLLQFKNELEITDTNYEKFLLLHSILMYYLTRKTNGPYVSMLSLNLICNPLLDVNKPTYIINNSNRRKPRQPDLVKYIIPKKNPTKR